MSNAGSLMMSNRNKVVDGLDENSDKRVGTAIDGIWVGKRGEWRTLEIKQKNREKTPLVSQLRIRKTIPKPRKKPSTCKHQVSAHRDHSQVSNCMTGCVKNYPLFLCIFV